MPCPSTQPRSFTVIRVALELVGHCGVGCFFNALDEDETNVDEWIKALRNLMCVPSYFPSNLRTEFERRPTIFTLHAERQMVPVIAKLGPAWLRWMSVPLYPKKAHCATCQTLRVLPPPLIPIVTDNDSQHGWRQTDNCCCQDGKGG